MSVRVGEFLNWADPDEGSTATEAHRRTRTAAPGGRMGSAAGLLIFIMSKERILGGRIASRATQRPITVQNRPVTQQGMQGVRPMSTRGEFSANARRIAPSGSERLWHFLAALREAKHE